MACLTAQGEIVEMWLSREYNFLSKDQRNKTEASDLGEGPYQQFKYYKKLKRARLI